MLQRSFIWIGWIAVIAVALWLRIDDLDARPIHFDEATGARIFSERLESADYQFDPTHFHGPLLSLSTSPIAKLYGQNRWQELSLSMLRTGPIIAGLLMVLTPLLWLKVLGPRAVLAAAALLASSPLLVYYSRMYIHETWLALFGMLTAAAIYHVIKSPCIKWATLAGMAAGLMFATKETVAISLLCWTFAGAACWLLVKADKATKERAPDLKTYIVPAACFGLSLLATAAVFYGSGLIDAFRTYLVYETTPGHDKAFGYYFKMLILPKHTLGMWWSEGGILLFGILACIFTFFKKKGVTAISFIAVGALLHILIYSFISYKTPWLMTLPWALLCLLAGCAFIKNVSNCQCGGKSVLLYGSFGLCLFFQVNQSMQANGRLSNHADNPYAYVPTSKNITQLPNWLKELDEFLGDQELEPIAVIGQNYWPLPWYLRDFDQVGYWPTAPEEMLKYSVVIAMPGNMAACNKLLGDTHTQLPRTLRSNVPIGLYLKNDIWDAWTKTEK